MIDWLINLVPWWVWLITAFVAVVAVWRLLGWQGALAAAAGLLAVLSYGRGRAHGKSQSEAEQTRKRDALQEKYDRIDAGPVDPGRAYDRLRDRSGRR